jgi:hypothetical protein
VVVGSPAYLAARGTPQHPRDLAAHCTRCRCRRCFSSRHPVRRESEPRRPRQDMAAFRRSLPSHGRRLPALALRTRRSA